LIQKVLVIIMTTKLRASGIAPTPTYPKPVFGNAPTDGRRHGVEIDPGFSASNRFKSKPPQAEELKK
jgi:hypothetical protein